ncbi:MAG: SprT family zinc-dependent metalloprotease [Proteobacteria bacterium]|nr:SprT family zinc-dependent metalloprotease [Pseudomonadota bacterium]
MERTPAAVDPLPEVSAEAVEQLHRRLGELLDRPIDVVGTNNRRSLVSWRNVDGMLRIRIQRQFALADDAVLQAIARFIDARDVEARAVVQAYASTFQERIPKGRPVFQPPAGRHHDLRDYLFQQNREFFEGQFRGRIGWSRAPRSVVRRRIRLGSWSEEHRLIRIHPALDAPAVPGWVISYVVFHEMLHAAIGVTVSGGRRRFHTREFKTRERAHPDYERAEQWIAHHRDDLLSW